jgi:NADH-quinone oxidoreductase subunit G
MEAKREEFIHDGTPDVDLVLTTREVIDMIKEAGIRFTDLEGETPDLPYGIGTGSATIFGTTGGVAEAVARRVVAEKSKNALQMLQFSGLREPDSIRSVSLPVGDKVLQVAVVHGLVNARKLLKEIEEGTAYYDLVEVMTCKTGCVGGAGQPHALIPQKRQRADGLYDGGSHVGRCGGAAVSHLFSPGGIRAVRQGAFPKDRPCCGKNQDRV